MWAIFFMALVVVVVVVEYSCTLFGLEWLVIGYSLWVGDGLGPRLCVVYGADAVGGVMTDFARVCEGSGVGDDDGSDLDFWILVVNFGMG